MFNKIFYSKTRVVFLILFLIVFFDFEYLPASLSVKDDRKLFYVLAFLFVLGIGSYKHYVTIWGKRLNYLFTLLLAFAVINCISCYFYRHQMPWITFYHWSPIFLVFLYYPFSRLDISVKSWEKILFTLFTIEVVVEIIQNLFPAYYLFKMTSSNEKFDNELRVRVYGNAILYIGCLFCLNKALVLDKRQWFYWIMYLLSLLLIFLGGYRIVLFANIVSSLILLYRLKKENIKNVVVLLVVFISCYGLLNSYIGKSRLKEMIERNESQNFENDDYVRLRTLNYYMEGYFKSPFEKFLGSGLVQRAFTDRDLIKYNYYESNYSRMVSAMSIRYHIFPIDWGLLGFSWEGGIPATIILILIALMFILSKTDKRYLYISAWGMFVLFFSITNGRYYSHHNLVYTAILLVICDKLCRVKKLKKIEKSVR